MTERKMKKILKRDRRRKAAQGVGALAGTAACFAILSAIYGSDMKEEAKKLGGEIAAKLGSLK